ncbi:MAG: hypothetical protein M3235_23000 [Actinomycetota bacterium]|nr:hypothetical protein [Actinomycetota bacterium]
MAVPSDVGIDTGRGTRRSRSGRLAAEVRGASNHFSKAPATFDAHSRAVGEIMAAHAALGLLAALEHDRNNHLHAALEDSHQIGIAIGTS